MSVILSPQSVAGSGFPGVDNGQWLQYAFFNAVVAGNYVAGGDPFTFNGVSPFFTSSFAPLQCTFTSQSGTLGHSGFTYYYRPGAPATLSNGRFQVLATGAGNQQALAEIAAGAYPGAVVTDTIVVNAAVVRL